MALKDLVIKNRSYRLFDMSQPVPRDVLLECIDTTRFAPATVITKTSHILLRNSIQTLFQSICLCIYALSFPIYFTSSSASFFMAVI